MKRNLSLHSSSVLAALVFSLAGCDHDNQSTPGSGVVEGHLEARCGDTAAAAAFTCEAPLIVTCDDGTGAVDVETLVIGESQVGECDGLQVSDRGPFPPGTHLIAVTDGNGDAVCTAELRVMAGEAPTIAENEITLWAPNHKFHGIRVEDCVTAYDSCRGALKGEFVWASSDEPTDDLGDGHHSPDILFDSCEQVQLRSERQGPKDGRVYRLGVRFDAGDGETIEGSCKVTVHHSKNGDQAVDSGEAYRIELDGTDPSLPVCDGVDDEEDDITPEMPSAGDPGQSGGEPEVTGGESEMSGGEPASDQPEEPADDDEPSSGGMPDGEPIM